MTEELQAMWEACQVTPMEEDKWKATQPDLLRTVTTFDQYGLVLSRLLHHVRRYRLLTIDTEHEAPPVGWKGKGWGRGEAFVYSWRWKLGVMRKPAASKLIFFSAKRVQAVFSSLRSLFYWEVPKLGTWAFSTWAFLLLLSPLA